MTLEAIILFHVDELDSKIDAFRRISKNENVEGNRWSKFVRVLDRFLYFPPESVDLNIKQED